MRERFTFGRRGANASDDAFAVVALETTGLFPAQHDRIIEIAVVHVRQDQVLDEWVTLVNPERDIGPTRIHGISAREVADAPMFREIAGDVADRLGDRVLVAHNGRFHADFVEAEMRRLGNMTDLTEVLCTMTLATGLGVTSRSLAGCCESVGVFLDDRRDALADARATAALLVALLGAAWHDRLDVVPGVNET